MTNNPRVLIVLDVDGTISPLPPPDGGSEPAFATPVEDRVIGALSEVAERDDVAVAWVTTWSPRMLRWLIDERLGHRLDGPHMGDGVDRTRGWRARAVANAVAAVGASAVVWIDDMAVRTTLERAIERAALDVDMLVIRPERYTGVTLRQAQRVRRFIEGLDARDGYLEDTVRTQTHAKHGVRPAGTAAEYSSLHPRSSMVR
ncbi:MAG: hypothetical protein JST33_06415 [Actinobacteria bacterium]|nr:hypothetical protein [Actinomycetota bacterium]